ncbi:hypothetical protein KAFR_0A01420 [Kazachstania africana CBS 2517]|uniref:Protein kinase domain-containing protein n=1 Tax=Kazachstania africana (strain ATCC 22294 / BCRC 22015 / CBS 2517 / CECT 1963 / NBRC 1671 / NRRL Y-8276) TaxID=1071382 RepID=H2AMI0_KAZAF|nr:hypothetical protein KAFR_0A01420 [Kazachstania africana CBS 2517]CCF55580.1 hypothetical protein KAFR_0A01420 [Kazachstania africana CBS 2517]
MPFLKKITHSHSRSGSGSSIKTGSGLASSASSSKQSSRSRKQLSTDSRGSHVSSSSVQHSISEADTRTRNSRSAILDDLAVYTLESTQSPIQVNTPTMSTVSEPAAGGSRKSSGDTSTNSLSFEKLILSWDSTDPEEWTAQRIASWLKFHEFPETWIACFRRYQLEGNRFLKLLARENFALYEKYLPESKSASYERFQDLLKQTLTKSVNYNHIRQKSLDRTKESRSSSESIKSRYKTEKSKEEVGGSRSASESILTPTKTPISKNDEKAKIRTHQKAKSASSLYRRSFISLRGSLSNSSGNKSPSSNIKLKIPSRPPSIVETSSATTKSITPPVSPSYPQLFKKHQKSSSSESSLLNSIRGTSHNSNAISPIAAMDEPPEKRAFQTSKNHSTESLPKSSKGNNSDVSSPFKQLTHEDRETLWSKIRRRSQFSSPQSNLTIAPPPLSSSPSSTRTLTPTTTNNASSPKTDVLKIKLPKNVTHTISDNMESPISRTALEKRFLPSRQVKNELYILVTKDNKSYIPVKIESIKTSKECKDLFSNSLGINHDNISIQMTDYRSTPGSPLTDDLLDTLVGNLFTGTTLKFFVKDLSSAPQRTRASTTISELHPSLRPKRSKNSVRSRASSMAADEVSIVTSSSDITSFDEHGVGRRYPQTPSYLYDTNEGEELNYWNVKDHVPDDIKAINKPLPVLNLSLPDKAHKTLTPKPSQGSFQIFRKEEASEIDFNKRRESPYVKPELAPKREAPKAPITISPQRNRSMSMGAAPKLRRSNTKVSRKQLTKPLPPLMVISSKNSNQSTDSIVSSYTPGSTQVLVPQPYKGANEVLRKRTSEDSLNPVSNFIMKQKINRSTSNASVTNSIYSSPSPLLKRGSSRRIVSSSSAADVFEENDITFADAPALPDNDDYSSDSSDDIIWSTTKPKGQQRSGSKETFKPDGNQSDVISAPLESNAADNIERKMTLRPSPEVVYQNLEKFFPRANLDKPVLEGVSSPTSPTPSKNIASFNATTINETGLEVEPSAMQPENGSVLSPRLKLPRRTKTIRTIAHEASEARKQSIKLKRQNTKMWGTRMVEVTEKQLVAINKSKNSRGEYKEFAWMKGEMIGKGSFGAVYLCLNVTTGEMMAVKQVEVPKYSSQDENIISTVEALRSEVSTLKDLDHLNIVQYLGFENKDNIYSLFLEYVAGGSVGSLIRMYGRFDEAMIRHLTIQVLRGLSYLHSRGILHRDMKADNLLLDQDGVCKISDFGISRKSNDIYSNSDMTMRGTVFWMAPEMVDTKQGYSAKVDIWSLGCVVLEMFAGKRPWSNLEVVAAMFKIGKSKSAPPIPEDTLPLISQDGRQFLDSCFEIDPESRPTADKLLSHAFSKVYPSFNFKSTELCKFIKSNDKINSSKLRVASKDVND